METGASVLSTAWTEVMNGVTQIMSNSTAALGLTLPMVGLVIGICKSCSAVLAAKRRAGGNSSRLFYWGVIMFSIIKKVFHFFLLLLY